MLIELDDSLIIQLEEFFKDVSLAIENIATGVTEGKHILIGSRELLQKLAQLSCISNRCSASIKQCMVQLPQFANLKNTASDFVQIIPEGTTHVNKVGWQRIIRVPIRAFSDTSMIQETILLGENLIDSKFFRIVASTYASMNQLGTLKVRCEERLGGGDTIVEVYRMEQEEKRRFCLCVVDSDKKYPNSDLGTIAKRLKDIDDESKPISRCVPLSCREAENMLSHKQLEELSAKDVTRLEALKIFEAIKKHDEKALFYVDIKKGLKLREVFSLHPENPFRKYWITCLHGICDSIAYDLSHCIEKCICSEPESSSCKCRIMPGFGDAIFEQVVTLLEKSSAKKVSEMLSDSVRDEWTRVGQTVFSWCMGRSRRSIL